MKILQVCPYFYPFLAGQEQYVLQLSKKLLKYGEHVDVYTSNYSNLQDFEIIDGIHVHRFDMITAPLNNPISITFLGIFRKLKSFDVVHIHNEHSFFSFITCLCNIYHKKPIVLTCHGQLIFGSYFKDLFEKIYSRTIGKFMFNAATKIIALSEEDKIYISSIGVDTNKIHVLPNAIDTDDLDKQIATEIDAKLSEKFVDNRLILFVGRIIPRKGIEYIIKCVKDVIGQFDDAIFILIGNGEYKSNAEQLCKEQGIEDHVIFLSGLPDEIFFSYYKLAEICILPSLSEGLPTTILESMYFETPVVATNIPGIRSHFKDVALLIPPKNEYELSKAIIRLLSDKKLAMSLRKKGKNLVTSNYTWNKVSKSYLEIYSNLFETEVKY
jgi:glycosyltransferase involved in cell wall biosynthesis